MRLYLLTLLILITSFSFTGCASGAKSENMAPIITKANEAVTGSKYYRNISINSVLGGEETNPLWTSEVSSSAFEEALTKTLIEAGYFNIDGDYSLSVALQKLKQPILGLTFDVVSTVDYSIAEKDSSHEANVETIAKTGTAGFSDAFSAVARLRLANERSIKKNIEALLLYLRENE